MSEQRPRFLGLIPARSGSKRLPRKNLMPLAGQSLLGWSIQAALGAQHLDRVILSTDDEEIATAGRQYGVDVPFMRPATLASDNASGLAVAQHAIRTLQAEGEHYDYIVTLQPTSPLRLAHDIDQAIALLLEKKANAVTSVCETDHPPEWSNTLPASGVMNNFYQPGIRNTRSQDLPTSYRLNGAIYIQLCAKLLSNDFDSMDANSYAYVMPRERSIDIDTAIDFDIAQLFMQRFGAKPKP